MDDNSLGQNDPYRKMQQAEKDSVRPGFLSRDESGKAPDDRAANAADSLGSAEKSAEGGFYKPEGGTENAREAEEQPGGFYSGGGRETKKKFKPTGFKGVVMKGGPIYAILFTILIAGGAMFGTQAFQPFSLVAQFTETLNSMHTSADARSEYFFKMQMSKRTVKSPYNIFGTDFSLSKKQKAKLKEQGIEYDEKYKIDGKEVKALKFTENGEEKIVTADNFKSIYSSDNSFAQKFNAGSQTWRGAIANWFGTNVVNVFLPSNRMTRSMFGGDYEEKVNSEGGTSADKRKVVQEIINEHIRGDGDLSMNVEKIKEETDDDGNTTRFFETEDPSTGRGVNSVEDVRSKIGEITGAYGGAANGYCALMNAIGAINLLVTANQALQIIQITTAVFESVDKAKAGYGDTSPIMVFADALNERKKTTNVVLEDDGKTSTAVLRDRTAMESAGISALYGGGLIDPDDANVKTFNMTGNVKKVFGTKGLSVSAFSECSAAKMASALASSVVDVTCLLTAGLGCIAELFSSSLVSAAVSAGVGAVVSLLIPSIANMMMRDLVAEFAGEGFGNALMVGAGLYLGGAHRANGGSLATMKKLKKFAVAQQDVIADNARFEREGLSPFDITSKYTFMGSILTQLMNYSHVDSVMDAITASGSVVSSSLASLSPSVSAYKFVETVPTMEQYENTCPYLASIGAIGDSFCNPYVITDMDTIAKDPVEVLDKVAGYGGISGGESDKNVTINADSDLAKYIKYCDNRQSPFGVTDQNIAGEVAGTGDIDIGNSTLNGAVNGAIGSLPIIGDMIDIAQSSEEMSYIGYISGESCVAGNTVNVGGSPGWNKAKYYQRFIEDQSLAESMGIIDKSAVTAFLEDYYEKNPLDNSYEGMLARYSGLTKDNVIALLDIIDYENYIASYDPSERMVFGAPLVEKESKMDFESEDLMGGFAVLTNRIVYADVRNRSFAV